VDEAATRALRARLRERRGAAPFFDRGPGYRQLAGTDHAPVDFVDGAGSA
jgi:N-methylhydantoinase B